jgi:hypothetical protein
LREIERFRVNFAVHREVAEEAERLRSDGGGR